ncbi:MAG: ribosomal protein S18-alanine N-acetyltransferase [Solobacterium sp.]|nr:ribosomal protein S18-alanine N-acetyltransferase [Solobacterium sp.]
MIRKMTLADLDRITEMEQILLTSPWPRSAFEYELTGNPFADLRVYEKDGKIIGYVDWWIMYDRAEIATIGVLEEYRRSGYAQEMMDLLVNDAREKDCENVTLEVRVSNLPAIRFYEKNGFIKVNVRKNYYDDNGEDAWLMVKPL